MADGRWTVDFWFDPSCPFSRRTSRWIREVAERVPLLIQWRVMSLAVLNEHLDDDPEAGEHGDLWAPARIATAVLLGHGHEALGEFHAALWTDPDGTHRDEIGDPVEALARCGFPESLAEAGASSDHDADLRASHHDAVSRIEAAVGTPILVITDPEGQPLRAMFGPVISEPVAGEAAERLWRAAVLLAGLPQFRELKA